MSIALISIIVIVALALLFDFSNGFHDAANSVSTVVATKAMSPRKAVIFSGAFNFAAYFFIGTAVANTISKTVALNVQSTSLVFAALFAAISWNYITWFFSMPSSSSHALLGGLVGAGIAAGGIHAINWASINKALLAIVASPLIAFGIAALAAFIVGALVKVTKVSKDAKIFKHLQLLSAAAVSFGHGANDAQKTMGVITALLLSTGHLSTTDPMPTWVALSAYSAISLGTMWGGWRIINTLGLRITNLNASLGLTANIGATTAIFGATALGIPISTTHAAASSVVGAGTASRQGVNWIVVRNMLIAWVSTLPLAAALAWLIYKATQVPHPYNMVVNSILTTALLSAILLATWHSNKAKDHHFQLQSMDPAPHNLSMLPLDTLATPSEPQEEGQSVMVVDVSPETTAETTSSRS